MKLLKVSPAYLLLILQLSRNSGVVWIKQLKKTSDEEENDNEKGKK